MKRKKYYPEVLALAAAVTVISAGIGKSWSYFTTYAEAAGGYTIRLGEKTDITESFSGWTKHVVITSEEESQPVYIRAKAFCGSQYTLLYSGEGWTLGTDGYYYYDEILYGGSASAALDLKIEGIPEDPEAMESFQVIVIYESTPVKYHEDGSAVTVQETDWSEILDTGSTESAGNPGASDQAAEAEGESGNAGASEGVGAGTEGGAEG